MDLDLYVFFFIFKTVKFIFKNAYNKIKNKIGIQWMIGVLFWFTYFFKRVLIQKKVDSCFLQTYWVSRMDC